MYTTGTFGGFLSSTEAHSTYQVVGGTLDVFMWMRKGHTAIMYEKFIYEKLS